MNKFPIFQLQKNGKRVAVNPNHVTALYESTKHVTEIYTLDCARDDDAWDVNESFDSVNQKISQWYNNEERVEQSPEMRDNILLEDMIERSKP